MGAVIIYRSGGVEEGGVSVELGVKFFYLNL